MKIGSVRINPNASSSPNYTTRTNPNFTKSKTQLDLLVELGLVLA